MTVIILLREADGAWLSACITSPLPLTPSGRGMIIPWNREAETQRHSRVAKSHTPRTTVSARGCAATLRGAIWDWRKRRDSGGEAVLISRLRCPGSIRERV